MSSIDPIPAVPPEPPAAVPSPAPAAARPAAQRPAPAPPEPQSPTRLLIEDVGGRYVYTLVDRISGQVIVQLPRDDLARLADVDQYGAGAVVNTKA